MANCQPEYSNRLVRGPHGEMIFIRANAIPPPEYVNNAMHRHATNMAREVLFNPKRFGNHADMNASSETINDDAVAAEFMASSANPWTARYSPYIGKGFVTPPPTKLMLLKHDPVHSSGRLTEYAHCRVPTKGRMILDSHIDRICEKVFKKKPPTVMDIYDKSVLSAYLKQNFGPRKTIRQKLNYLKQKWQLWRLSEKEKHNLVKAILQKVCYPSLGE
jgi:hypothetical protein